MSTVRLCAVEQLTSGEARRFDVEGHRIALVRVRDSFYAIGDRCSHAEVSLSEGEVDLATCTVECIKHGSTFDLRTGVPTTLPATVAVPVYEVEVANGQVSVRLP